MTVALIVDDNEENRYLLRQLLAADGFSVVEAPNGRAALDCAEELPVALVVSDVLMPGMDGFELCRQWKGNPRLRNIPFVFYTATYTDPKDETFALSLGADGFFVKPTDPGVLRDRLRDVVRQQRAGTLARGDGAPPLGDAPYLQEYNRVLVRKLEDKVSALEVAERELRIKDFALASSESGVVLTNDASIVTWVNPAFGRSLGTLESTVAGTPLGDWLVLPSDWNDWATRGHGARHFSSSLVPKRGHGVPASLKVSAHAILSQEGERVGFMLSCVDVSEERRLRRELERVQRLESLGLFAAGVAHDFNNLLMAMLAGVELGTAPGLTDAEREDHRSVALAGFQRARDLTRRLLAFARNTRAERRPVDLKELIEETILLSLSGSPVRCERRFAEGSALIFADPGQLAQVFSNLLVNARQAMNDRGSIVVSVELPEQPARADGSMATQRFALVRVADDGPGISPNVLPDIFDPYFTTRPEGTGLGLATCHAIVHDHGGRIGVSSELGQGTTFDVWLPWSPDLTRSQPAPADSTPRIAPARILVMEGIPALRALLQRALEHAGYAVVSVESGKQAVREHERATSDGAGFDLLILDVTVRGEMDGLEVVAELRRLDADVPILASTGYADEAITGQLRSKGFSHVLRKPYMIPELLATIGSILAS